MRQSKTLKERLAAPTPRFFKKIRNAGLVLAAASAALLASPVALPAVVVQLAGYLAVAGSVATAVSQTVTGGHKRKKDEMLPGGETGVDSTMNDKAVGPIITSRIVKNRKTKNSG